MPLFELDGGRLIPAQFGHEVSDGFDKDLLELVQSQVLEIVSRPLFPITWNNIGYSRGAGQPRLTALDAAGQVVAVEVVKFLDSEVLIESLSSLADVASMSWAVLARHYPRGTQGFKREWIAFRDAMPTSPPAGPRLVLIAAGISDDVRPALDVLSSSGVEVHVLSLRQMSNGRTFLDVDAVSPRLYGHHASPLVEAAEVVSELAARPVSRIPVPVSPQVRGGVDRGVSDRKLGRDAKGLFALASMLGADTPLSLRPPSRTPSGAVLTAAGRVRVPSGEFTDPTVALVAQGFRGEDGWGAWSLGDHFGPTLAESLDEVNRMKR